MLPEEMSKFGTQLLQGEQHNSTESIRGKLAMRAQPDISEFSSKSASENDGPQSGPYMNFSQIGDFFSESTGGAWKVCF